MNTNKAYCTQNEENCSTCSFVSYQRDCRNNPLGDANTIETATVEPMTRGRFEHEMARARTMQGLDTGGSEYWTGYQRGLRRAYHGENFGTPKEHLLWLTAVNSDDTMRHQRGQGYRDGLKGRQCVTKSIQDY